MKGCEFSAPETKGLYSNRAWTWLQHAPGRGERHATLGPQSDVVAADGLGFQSREEEQGGTSSSQSAECGSEAYRIFVPRSVEPAQCGVRRRCDARQHRHTSTFPDLDNQESEMGSRACQRTILVEQCRFQKRADLASRAALDAGRALMLTLLRTGMQAQGPARPREAWRAPPDTTCLGRRHLVKDQFMLSGPQNSLCQDRLASFTGQDYWSQGPRYPCLAI